MKKQLEIFKTYRKAIVDVVENLDLEQIQQTPDGFSNSIFWNTVHILVTQQLLHYKQSGQEMLISSDWVENYKRGTHPRFLINEDEVEYVKRKLISTSDQFENDYHDKKFLNYREYETSMGIVLTSIGDSICYNNVHEGIHYGLIKAMKKIIS